MNGFESTEESDQLAEVDGVCKAADTPEGLVRAVAGGLFSFHPPVWKACKAGLAKHADPKVAAFFKGEKRKYAEIEDAKKVQKVLTDLAGLGMDAVQVAEEAVRFPALRDESVTPGLLGAALAVGAAPERLFAHMANVYTVHLPKLKSLPPGLSRLRALGELFVLSESFKSAANVEELAQIPQPFFLQLSIRNVQLKLFDACKTNVSGLGFVDSASALDDLSLLRGWTRLQRLQVKATGVTDLSPLAELPLTEIDLSNTAVADLSPLASTPLTKLNFNFAQQPVDLTPLVAPGSRSRETLTHLAIWGSHLVSLEPLAQCPNLVEVRFDPKFGSFPGMEALATARPDVKIGL